MTLLRDIQHETVMEHITPAFYDYFEGEKKFPRTSSEVKQLIGKNILYVPSELIDKSGRGYFWTRTGTVKEVKGRNVNIDGNWYSFRNLVAYKEIK